MDWQLEADEARKRLKQLETEVDALKKRMDDLIRRVTQVEGRARGPA
jgi:uncharacterized protein involved in exopolysaccharide biosynthesis